MSKGSRMTAVLIPLHMLLGLEHGATQQGQTGNNAAGIRRRLEPDPARDSV